MRTFFKHLFLAWKMAGAEVELKHAIKHLAYSGNDEQDSINILRNLRLELKQDWNEKIEELLLGEQ